MALPKVCGLETEFGIVVTNDDEFNPVVASSLLINSYADNELRKVRWDFDDESPGRDARGFIREGVGAPEIETHLVNVVLTNGARYYVDHAHPEYSSPEVLTPIEAVLYDKAGEWIVAESIRTAQRLLPDGRRILVYKNNSDGKGNSYGAHENYLVDREVAFGRIVTHMLPFLSTRQVFCGAGKVGSEHGRPDCDFQITQRADFFEEEVGLETTLKRPIVNTRDEPHADAGHYRRLHVIIGDANMAEVSIFLKVGTTALVLAMVEDVPELPEIRLQDPVRALHEISHDPTCRHAVELADGTRATAVEIQWEFLERVRKYVETRDADPDADTEAVLTRWEAVLSALEDDPMRLDGVLDWPTKYGVLKAFRERHGHDWDSPAMRMVDLQYHDVRRDRGVAYKLMDADKLERLLTDADVARAVHEPPGSTRAYFRGRCLERYSSAILAANWDSLIFDVGGDPLKRVPMPEPLRGTRAHVGELIDRCDTPQELLGELGA